MVKNFLLCTLLSLYSACSEPAQKVTHDMSSTTSLTDWFQSEVFELRNYQQRNWPADADTRYVGQALSVSFEYRTAMLKDPEALREALIVYLEDQAHPEAQCVSFENTKIDSEWSRLQYQIVCR